ALSRKDFKGVDQRAIDLARQAIEGIRNTATNYFEAKPQRAVKLNEFKGAVVPKGIAAESLAILEKNGITVEFYGKTEGAREKAIEKLAKRLDRQSGDVLFSFAGEKSLTHDDLYLAFAQDMVARGQDPEKVRQETGWFQGKDGKWRYEISDKEAFTKGT
ncbi:LPD23 domain-containing protein, partial [Arthrospira platensis SPKY1]|nr:LPD23 domain-containing protein [Arthrospira platensis SPKY1]